MSNQSAVQAHVRTLTGTAGSYSSDWHALFDRFSIAAGDFNGRLLAWINAMLGASYPDLPGAMAAYATALGYDSWSSMGGLYRDALDAGLTVTRADATGTYFDSSGVLRVADADTARFTYENGYRELLVGESRTNLVTRSNEFSNAVWTKTNSTITSGVDDGEGGTSAFTMTATAANGLLQQSPTVTSGVALVTSFYVRRRTGSGTFNLRCGDNVNIPVTLPATGWHRLEVTSTPTTTTGRCGITLATSGDAVDIKYAQLEVGSKASSYIPTTSAAVTRNADRVELLGADFSTLWPVTEGTILADYVIGSDTVSKSILDISDGTSNERVRIVTTSGSAINPIITDGAATVFNQSGGTLTGSTRYKTALAFKLDDSNYAHAGTAGTADTSVTLPTVDRMMIGANLSFVSSTIINGRFRAIPVFPWRLPGAAMAALAAA